MRTRRALVLALAGYSTVICAQPPGDWKPLTATDDSWVLYDAKNIGRTVSQRKIWIWERFREPQKDLNFAGQFPLSSLTLRLVRCESEEIAIASVAYYLGSAMDGKVLGSAMRQESELNWSSAHPATVDGGIIRTACSR